MISSRPIFHHKQEAVKSHILICFAALIIGKFLEINTKLSLKQIIDAIWVVTDAKLYDKVTKNTFTLRSELNQSSMDVVDKIDIALSY